MGRPICWSNVRGSNVIGAKERFAFVIAVDVIIDAPEPSDETSFVSKWPEVAAPSPPPCIICRGSSCSNRRRRRSLGDGLWGLALDPIKCFHWLAMIRTLPKKALLRVYV